MGVEKIEENPYVTKHDYPSDQKQPQTGCVALIYFDN